MICQSVLHFSYSLFIYYLKITWKTHKPYIFAIVCLLSSRFIKSFLLFIQLSFPARQKFLCESTLWLRVWIKHALQESVQLSWGLIYKCCAENHPTFVLRSFAKVRKCDSEKTNVRTKTRAYAPLPDVTFINSKWSWNCARSPPCKRPLINIIII